MIRIWIRNLEGLKKQGAIHLMKEVNAPDTDGTQGVAMIAIFKTHKPLLFYESFLLTGLKGHLQGDLHRCGPIVRIKDACEVVWRYLDKFFSQLQGGHMTHP